MMTLVAALVAWLAWQLAAARRVGERAASEAAGSARRTRAMLSRVPRAAWICVLVACLNAACWSLITPPFQVPDEQTHFAYTQMLVENQQLPESIESAYSPEEEAVLVDLRHQEVRGSPETPEISSPEQEQILKSALAGHLSRHPRAIGSAARYPPLYYLLQAIPYGLASPGTLLDQLALMRLFSALLAGVTALFVFLFVREALPAARWTWTVAGLCAATAPLLGFMSGAVNPDAMLFAISAATFYCLARGFRRGLTPRLAALLGGLIAVGFLTKPNFVGLAPGVVLGVLVLAVRAARAKGPRVAAVSLALSLAIASSPIVAYVLVNLAANRAALGIVSYALNSGTGPGSILAKASYIWQVYLPRLPGMRAHFPGLSTTRLWFDRYVGFYGWLDTTFPRWVDTAALVPAGLIGLLCIRGLALGLGALRRRAAELAVYAAIAAGLAVLVGAGAYVNMSGEGFDFVEPRYLMPLLPLLALALALAARGAGRRRGPAVGAAIVMLFLAHDVLSQLLVIGRFYG
jgi:4-amino-4-deoxy-L-arabinose transferase-like glycosyltransferase